MKLFGFEFGRSDPAPVRQAMEAQRRAHPTCEACNTAPVDIHHIIPVAVNRLKAADPDNLMSLCPTCHITHGHAGDKSCRHYVPNVRKVLSARKIEVIKCSQLM